jgi:glyoxylase-like metal-dependent hydrolase (beta-lactamase superfamily II)
MAEVEILIKGHLADEAADHSYCPTISLVKDGGIIMVVDPGVLPNQKLLAEKLKERGLSLVDVNFVFLTHSHFDHYCNVGLFSEAKVLEYFGLWERNRAAARPEQLSPSIKIIPTPGHTSNSLTALVKTAHGVVALCGDVFWQEDYPADDPYARDKEKLAASRRLIKELADYIVPGHGDIFKVRK